MKKIEIFLLAIVLIVAILLRTPLVLQGFFSFTSDQGRDLLEVEKIIYEKNLKFIGPTTGLPGIFYGPWWYYYLLPIFLISKGDPMLITLSFGVLGTLVVIASYFFLKKLTQSKLIAFGISLSLAMSQLFVTHSSQIWSPSLVLPLMLIYIFALRKLDSSPSKKWFIILGILCGLIMDSEAAFGVVLIISTIGLALVRKKLISFNSLSFFFGLLATLTPRIIFELKNNFLITKAVLAWVSHPAVFQQRLSLPERFINRLQLFNHNFAQTFTGSDDKLAMVVLLLLLLIAIRLRPSFKKDHFYKTLLFLVFFLYLCFSLFPDAVWDYYLVGLPIIVTAILALFLKTIYQKSKFVVFLFLSLMITFNLNSQLISPFSISWEGDGAVYKNQKLVLDSIKKYMQGDYSVYIYTPSMFDYPFDYLISWYSKRNLIVRPKENQKNIYLIIRDDNSHLYMPTGWYGDKTKDKTTLLEKLQFPGNINFERHLRND